MAEPALPEKRRVHPAVWLLVGLAVGAAGGAAVTHQLQPAPKPAGVSTVYVTSTVTAAAPTAPATSATTAPAAAGPDGHKLGTTVAVSQGSAHVTVYSYRAPVAANAPRPAHTGYTWGSIDVKVCVGEDGGVTQNPWTLVYADDTQIDASNVEYNQFPEPAYPVDKALKAGRCVRGWITFPIPKSPRPVMVEYSLDSGETVDWKI